MRLCSLIALLLPSLAVADIHYTLTPLPDARAVAVTVSPDHPKEVETFHIPGWCPGFYFLQKYQDKMYDVAASDDKGNALTITPVDSQGWRIENPKKRPLTFSYKVKGDDAGMGFFGVKVHANKTFANGAATFVYVDGRKEEPTQLALKLPDGWDCATGMTRRADGVLTAGGYDELIDHPLQLGKFEKRSFKIGESNFDVVWASADDTIKPDINAQNVVLQKIAEPPIKMFGGAPFKHYVFILHLTNQGFLGGLEHRGSTCIAMPNTGGLDLTTLAAHEFFHTWNVKNIRPKLLGPFDYTREQRTGNLWFAEGVTDYYANINAYRSGLRDAKWLYGTLGGEVSALQRGKTRLKITLEDACKQTWESGGFGFDDLDYYNKGLIAGFVFDAAIRGTTNGAKSLDDMMRSLFAKYRLPNPGYPEDGLRVELNRTAGADLSTLYNTVIRSTNEVPYEGLQEIGLRVLVPATQVDEPGFTSASSVIDSVTDTGKSDGFQVGDEIVSGTREGIVVRRAGQTLTLKPTWTSTMVKRYSLEENPLATADQRKQLLMWLSR